MVQQATWANRSNPINSRFGLEMLEQRSLFHADLSLAIAHITPPAELAVSAVSFLSGVAPVKEDAAPSIREAIKHGTVNETEIDYESATIHTGEAVKVNPQDCDPVTGELVNGAPVEGIAGAMFLAVSRGFNPFMGFDVVISVRGFVPGMLPPPVRAPHVPDAPHHHAPPPASDSGVVNDNVTSPTPTDGATGGVSIVQSEQSANVLRDSPARLNTTLHTNPIAAEILDTTAQTQSHVAAPVIQTTASAGIRGTFINAGETASGVRTARVLAGALGGIFAKQLIDTAAQSAAGAIQVATKPIETVAATVAQIAPASYFIPRLGSPYEFMWDSIATLSDEFAGVPSLLGNVDVELTADPRRAWFVTAIVIAADVLLLTYVLRQRAARKLQVARG